MGSPVQKGPALRPSSSKGGSPGLFVLVYLCHEGFCGEAAGLST